MASRRRSLQQKIEPERRDIELTASFAMSSMDAPRFELFSGVHPLEQRHLSEEEERWPLWMLRTIQRKDLLALSQPNIMEQLALLWLKYFPEIDDLFSQYREQADFNEALRNAVLSRTEILHLAYAFYPSPSSSQFEQYPQIRAMQVELQHALEEKTYKDSRSKGKVTWTFPFPIIGQFGQEVERCAGLSSRLKGRLSLNNYAPGLLCNYLLHRGMSMEDVLDPHQFEDLVGSVFQAEGWKVKRMQPTCDGGKDIVASKVVDGQPMTVYIQAKRYAQHRPIPVEKLREFIFTLASDGLNQGYMVTTSRFSSAAKKLQHTMKVPLATVELIDKSQLETIMLRISEADIPVYLL